jgi:hypothetical protein
VAPVKAGKPGIVPISGYPFSAGLYGEGRKIGVRNEVTTCVGCLAKADEYFPVARSREYGNAVGTTPNLRYEIEGGLERGRPKEDPRMCHDSEEPGECEVRETISSVAVHNALQPVSIAFVAGCVCPMGIYEYVNVDEDQGPPP